MPEDSDLNFGKQIIYSVGLMKATNQQVKQEALKHLYGDVRMNKRGAIIQELIERVDNEDDIMKQELKRGIL